MNIYTYAWIFLLFLPTQGFASFLNQEECKEDEEGSEIDFSFFDQLMPDYLSKGVIEGCDSKKIKLVCWLGHSKVGKSTCINLMLGNKVRMRPKKEVKVISSKTEKCRRRGGEDIDDTLELEVEQKNQLFASIGITANSCTTRPIPYLCINKNKKNKELSYIHLDCPGFGDSQGKTHDLCNKLAIEVALKDFVELTSFVLVFDAPQLVRYQNLKETFKAFKAIFPRLSAEHVRIVFTKGKNIATVLQLLCHALFSVYEVAKKGLHGSNGVGLSSGEVIYGSCLRFFVEVLGLTQLKEMIEKSIDPKLERDKIKDIFQKCFDEDEYKILVLSAAAFRKEEKEIEAFVEGLNDILPLKNSLLINQIYFSSSKQEMEQVEKYLEVKSKQLFDHYGKLLELKEKEKEFIENLDFYKGRVKDAEIDINGSKRKIESHDYYENQLNRIKKDGKKIENDMKEKEKKIKHLEEEEKAYDQWKKEHNSNKEELYRELYTEWITPMEKSQEKHIAGELYHLRYNEKVPISDYIPSVEGVGLKIVGESSSSKENKLKVSFQRISYESVSKNLLSTFFSSSIQESFLPNSWLKGRGKLLIMAKRNDIFKEGIKSVDESIKSIKAKIETHQWQLKELKEKSHWIKKKVKEIENEMLDETKKMDYERMLEKGLEEKKKNEAKLLHMNTSRRVEIKINIEKNIKQWSNYVDHMIVLYRLSNVLCYSSISNCELKEKIRKKFSHIKELGVFLSPYLSRMGLDEDDFFFFNQDNNGGTNGKHSSSLI